MGLVGMFVVAVVGAGAAHAQAAADPKATAAAAAASAKADYLMLYDEVAKRIEDLGAAIPEDKYGYRPAEGVRTVGEVLNHTDGASYLFAKVTGVAVPADAPKDPEKGPGATKKADILANLKRSLAFGRANAAAVTPETLATHGRFLRQQDVGTGGLHGRIRPRERTLGAADRLGSRGGSDASLVEVAPPADTREPLR